MPTLERSPTLATIGMIESYVEEHSGEFGLTVLWKNLPKQTMYPTYRKTIEYFIESCKVIVDCEGKLVWIFNPALMKKIEDWPEI